MSSSRCSSTSRQVTMSKSPEKPGQIARDHVNGVTAAVAGARVGDARDVRALGRPERRQEREVEALCAPVVQQREAAFGVTERAGGAAHLPQGEIPARPIPPVRSLVLPCDSVSFDTHGPRCSPRRIGCYMLSGRRRSSAAWRTCSRERRCDPSDAKAAVARKNPIAKRKVGLGLARMKSGHWLQYRAPDCWGSINSRCDTTVRGGELSLVSTVEATGTLGEHPLQW